MTPTPSQEPGDAAAEVVRYDARDLAAAITRGWRPYRWRAYAVGGLAGIIVGGIFAPIVTTAVELELAIGGLSVDQGLPWAEIIWSAVFVLTFAAVGAWTATRWLPADFRAATESYLWLSVRAEDHWRTVFGDRPVPRSAAALRDFVTLTPETPDAAGERAAAWLALGDLAAARRSVEQMPDDTALARHARAVTTWMVDFAGGTITNVEPLRASAAEIEDPAERLEAETDIAANVARIELAAGRDWKPPLAAVRERLGGDPGETVWRHVWRSTFRGMFAVAAIGVAAYWVFALVR